MASHYWIKLYHEILDDPKVSRLPDQTWRRMIELLLLAGKTADDGSLPSASDIAWHLRISENELLEDLTTLAEIGIVTQNDGRWHIPNFAKRQAATPNTERQRQHREKRQREQYYEHAPDTQSKRKCNEGDNKGGNESITTRNVDTDTDTDTDTETDLERAGGAGAPKTPRQASKNTKPQTRTPRIDQAMFAAVGDLCKIDLALLTKKTRGQLNQTGKKLRGANASVVDVEAFEEWWYTIDWRGKKGQPPNTGLVLECWGQFEEWRKDGRPVLKPTPSIALQPATTDQTRVKTRAQDIPIETRLMQREALKKHKEWKRRKDAGEDVGPAPGAEA